MAAVSQAAAARTSPVGGAAGDYCDTQLPPSSLSTLPLGAGQGKCHNRIEG
jgi:hypothetical protein